MTMNNFSRKLDRWSVGKEKLMYKDTSKLIVWQKSHKLVLKIYEITKEFPRDERFGLIFLFPTLYFPTFSLPQR